MPIELEPEIAARLQRALEFARQHGAEMRDRDELQRRSQHARAVAMLLRRSGLAEHEQTLSLAQFQPTRWNARARKVAGEFLQAAASGRVPSYWMVFYGPHDQENPENPPGNGTGKTYLSKIIVAEMCRMRLSARIYSAPDLTLLLQAKAQEGAVLLRDLVEELKNLRLLWIDDFGKEGVSRPEFRDTKLFQILDWRYNRGLPVGMSTVASVDGLGQVYGTDIVSRIAGRTRRTPVGCTWIAMGGPDWRFRGQVKG